MLNFIRQSQLLLNYGSLVSCFNSNYLITMISCVEMDRDTCNMYMFSRYDDMSRDFMDIPVNMILGYEHSIFL